VPFSVITAQPFSRLSMRVTAARRISPPRAMICPTQVSISRLGLLMKRESGCRTPFWKIGARLGSRSCKAWRSRTSSAMPRCGGRVETFLRGIGCQPADIVHDIDDGHAIEQVVIGGEGVAADRQKRLRRALDLAPAGGENQTG